MININQLKILIDFEYHVIKEQNKSEDITTYYVLHLHCAWNNGAYLWNWNRQASWKLLYVSGKQCMKKKVQILYMLFLIFFEKCWGFSLSTMTSSWHIGKKGSTISVRHLGTPTFRILQTPKQDQSINNCLCLQKELCTYSMICLLINVSSIYASRFISKRKLWLPE